MADRTDAATPTTLWVERTGTRRYTGRSSRGAQVLVGSAHDAAAFTPGELLKIALAACTAMSADAPLAQRLGADFTSTVRVSGDADREHEVYPELNEVLEVDLSELSEEAQERLRVTVQRTVDRVCTVGRTLKAGAEVALSFRVDG